MIPNTPDLFIHQYLQWHQDILLINGRPVVPSIAGTPLPELPDTLYRLHQVQYPRYFKMDLLSKIAFLSAELIAPYPENTHKERVATVISSHSGSLDVDKKFEASRQTLASPALFVYTLPNIMLGEICIRHGFKGEQLCTITEAPDPAWLHFYLSDLLNQRQSEACLCGHIDAGQHHIRATLFWVSKVPKQDDHALAFSEEHLRLLFTKPILQ